MFKRRRQKQEDSNTGKIIKKRILLPLILVLILAFLYLLFRLFLIESQSVKLEDMFCATNISQDIDLIGKNIFAINRADLKDRLQKKYACVKDLNIEKKYPNKINVTIYGRRPFNILNFTKEASPSISLQSLEASPSSQTAQVVPNLFNLKTESEKKIVIDSSGFYFSQNTQKQNVPEIEVVNSEIPAFGSFVPSNFLIANSMLSYLKSKGFNVYSNKIVGDYIFAVVAEYNQKNIKLLFNLNKEKDKQLASLQVILQKATMSPYGSHGEIEGREIETIDLRFDKPVVVYSSK